MLCRRDAPPGRLAALAAADEDRRWPALYWVLAMVSSLASFPLACKGSTSGGAMGETGGGDRWYEFLRIPGQSRLLAFLFLPVDYAG